MGRAAESVEIRKELPENAQLASKPASTHNKLTLATVHSRLKKCMHRTFTQ